MGFYRFDPPERGDYYSDADYEEAYQMWEDAEDAYDEERMEERWCE